MNIRKQRGLTLIGFGIVLALGIFFAYTGMKIIPIYLEYNALLNALKTVQSDPGAVDMTAGQVRNKIINSLWVSYASNNIKREHIHISRSEGIKIRVVYEVRKTWIGNIDLIAHFDKTVKLRG
ncbi:MAG TPA: DUF4845 domain-containing protein [Xanthomonadales bacterium]|nr:DUF4845 domain-containing protein [Xanthomonadales bacterium]